MKKLVRAVAGVFWSTFVLLVAGNALAAGPFVPDPQVVVAFDDLETYIAGLTDAAIGSGSRGIRTSLTRKVENAEAAYAKRGQPCTAANILGAYLNEARALRQGRRMGLAEDLYNRGRTLRDDLLLKLPPGSACRNPRLGMSPAVSISASDNKRFAAGVSFGAPRLWTVEAGGESWTQLELPAVQSLSGVPGLPAVPVWRALVAVPQGSNPVLAPPTTVVGETLKLNLYPFQSDAADQGKSADLTPIAIEYADPPFSKNRKAYATNAFYPPNPCTVTPLGQYRDLQMAQILCAAGQYNPVRDELRLFSSVKFDIGFEGGDGIFVSSQSFSPFELGSKAALATPLNKGVIADFVRKVDITKRICLGAELLILTHPEFRAPADELAQWKRDKGISTLVHEVGEDTPYDTADKIDDLIETLYDRCVVRPSYVLILGDSEFVPPAATDYDTTGDYCGNCGDTTTGSDFGYAIYPQFLLDIFLDFAVARIPVDTLDEAQDVVDKIVGYESDPPFVDLFRGDPFYTTAAFSSAFQCCRMNQDGTARNGQPGTDQRAFIETAELLRDLLLDAGYDVQRIYTETVDNGGYCLVDPGGGACPPDQIQQAYAADTTPRRYHNGTLLPADLGGGSGFAWNGATGDITDAFNEGRFLVLQRDHGSSLGFSNPSFTTGNLPGLTNSDLLPVVYSVNCASGYWDRESNGSGSAESFMEQALMADNGGMVGGLGDVRNSPTWANNAIARGFFDATWPGLAPEFGDATSTRRLGDILNHGKTYLLTQVGVAQTAGEVELEAALAELVMWHAFGDPTLEMWTSNPHRMQLKKNYLLEVLANGLRVQYSIDGAEITALQATEKGLVPVGRAVVQGGVAEIPYFHPPVAGTPIMLSASKENAVSVLLTSNELPDLVVGELSLPDTLLAPGEDLAGQLGVKVRNLGAGAAPGTVSPDGSIESGYAIELVLSSDTLVPPGFAFINDDGLYAEDELLKGGRISRTPDVPGLADVQLSPEPPVSSDVGGIVPPQIPGGQYHLCARIDPGDAVLESDEGNNVTCIPIAVTGIGIDRIK
jgi:hypothetical protein